LSLIPVEEAVRRVLQHAHPLPSEHVSLLGDDLGGRVLAAPVRAAWDVPADALSAMDGYAVRADDVRPDATYSVAMRVPAGRADAVALPPGAVARIFTGAPLPPGADAVVLQEDTEVLDAPGDAPRVRFRVAVTAGENVRHRASDVASGQLLSSPGHALRPADLNLLLAQGVLAAALHRRPTVALLSSGDELIEPGAGPPSRGQVVNGNAWALAAAVREAGGVPRVLPRVADDREATARAVDEALAADVLVTTGGVSVGDHDHMGPTLAARCAETLGFWKVALKPGKPLLYGRVGERHVFGLPGNPVSALVTFELFVRPLLLRLLGHGRVLRRPTPARVVHTLPETGRRAEYLRARLEHDASGSPTVDARRTQSSGALTSLVGADALIVRPPGAPAAEAGASVPVLLLGPDAPWSRLEPDGYAGVELESRGAE
jgi:molybdopterin molybdotransferase